MSMNEIIVISVGGSLICPDNIDINFLKRLKEVIIKHVEKGKRFVLITGGGKTARDYQFAAREIGLLNNEDLDWLGIHATRINAHLVRTIFKHYAELHVNHDPTEKVVFNEKILVASGWKPGFSTDYDAVLLAKQFKVKKIINLSNIYYVYDKDPAKYGDAKPYKTLSWKDYRKMFSERWDPGLNMPFDPVASEEAEKQKMTVIIINGADMDNLHNLLEEKNFVGTIIS
jgi:uridylate kinase